LSSGPGALTLLSFYSPRGEVEEGDLVPLAPLRGALHKRLKVEIPELDYQRLGRLDQVVGYLAKKLG
jgi:hypothetical protein